MKRIVLCFDGTWQSVDDPASVSNVVRVAQAVLPVTSDGVQQTVYYQAGVGSNGGFDRFLGGVFGVGLRNNVKRGLAFLSLNWNVEDGDEIYIYGFSRGAYTARALAGVIGAIGGIPKQEHFDKLEEFWSYYRIDPKVRNADTPDAITKRQRMRDLCYPDEADKGKQPIIKCLGVWDTVGSYGVPSGLGLGGLARRMTSWTKGFHDKEFGRHVEMGLHALAIDERRRGFPPTAWLAEAGKPLPVNNHVEQVWFAGAHSNVGGSYRESGLSDLALIWMMARSWEMTGLEFDEAYVAANFWPCAACSLYNSVPSWMVISRIRPFLRSVLAEGVAETTHDGKKLFFINEKVHWSVVDRFGRTGVVDETRYAKYKPRNMPTSIPPQKIAQRTPKEDELIAACRNSPKNERRANCVLHRQIGPKPNRRMRRIAALQKMWAPHGTPMPDTGANATGRQATHSREVEPTP